MTAELQKLWLAGRPVLIIGTTRDVAMNADGTYQIVVEYGSIGSRHTFLQNEIRVKLRCPESLASSIIRNAKGSDGLNLYADTAVVAAIDRIEVATEPGSDGGPITVLIGIGKCVDGMALTEDIRW